MIWLWFFHPRYPFVLRGRRIRWCCYCAGWGADPRDTDDCPLCYGSGFERRKAMGPRFEIERGAVNGIERYDA